MDPSEQAFLDGTHPALHRDADAMATLRSTSPPRSHSPSHSRSSSSSSNGQPRFSAIDPDPPAREPAPLRSGGKGSSNTGVKGVRADYREFQESQNRNGEEKQLAKQMGKKLMISLDDDPEEEQDEEKAALEKYRQQRMRELQGSGERGLNSQGGERKVFEHLREIGFEQFLGAVEGETDDVAVVLHLYEPVRLLSTIRDHKLDHHVSFTDTARCSSGSHPLYLTQHSPYLAIASISSHKVPPCTRLRTRLYATRSRR